MAPRFRQYIELGQIAMAAFRFDHEKMTRRVMGKGPAHRLSRIFRDQENTVALGGAMLQLAPMIGGEGRISPAVGLESGLIILQAVDERQNRRFVGGQTCFADANGRAP